MVGKSIHLHLREVHGAARIHQSPNSNRYDRYRRLDRPSPFGRKKKKWIKSINCKKCKKKNSHTYRRFGMFRFEWSQRTSNCWNVIYCFMLTRICIQFYIEFLKTWPHYLIYERFSYRFTKFQWKIKYSRILRMSVYFLCWFPSNDFDDFITISVFFSSDSSLIRFSYIYKIIHINIFPLF